jgi:hypothetical protein
MRHERKLDFGLHERSRPAQPEQTQRSPSLGPCCRRWPLSKHYPFEKERKLNDSIAKMHRNALFLSLFLLFVQKPSGNDGFTFAVSAPKFAPSAPGRASIRFPFSQSRKPRRLETASLEIRDEDKPQSVAAASFSLMKAIVGSGVLALPAGLAVVSDVPKA